MNERSWYPLTGDIGPTAGISRAVPRAGPIDPLDSPPMALAGRVVTMNDGFAVRDEAIVYMQRGAIAAVQDRAQAPPAGFSSVPVIDTGGTIFPGLIDLHNHLSYNALPLWSPVPKRFTDRGQWPNHKDYRPLVSGPMTVIGEYQDATTRTYPLLAPLVRYVECKCLLGGVTTTQGVKLASNAGIQRFYRGIVRNVEQTDDADLSEAQARIPDLDAKDARSFLARLKKEDSCFLLHLSEGITDAATPLSPARKHFLALEVAPGDWALNDVFTGIHAAGLLPQDFEVLATHGCSIVWSPLSNLLLYGGTARIDAAKLHGLKIGLGSDWSPTGSKNLLGEMKVAWLHSQQALNGACTARDIVTMATRDAARILRWDTAVGSIEPGKRADLLVIGGMSGDPYEALIRAKETDIALVVINGVRRYGDPAMMHGAGSALETIRVGGHERCLFLAQATSDPAVAPVTLAAATAALRDALANIATLAEDIEHRKSLPATRALDARTSPTWSLALDEICHCGVEFAPRLPFAAPGDYSGAERAPRVLASAVALSKLLKPIKLDPLTVADDETFLERIATQPNVPTALRQALASLF